MKSFPRSLLFVPAHQPRMLARAWHAGAEALVLDLEDSVPPDEKAAARAAVAALAPPGTWTGRVFARVNAWGLPEFADDARITWSGGGDSHLEFAFHPHPGVEVELALGPERPGLPRGQAPEQHRPGRLAVPGAGVAAEEHHGLDVAQDGALDGLGVLDAQPGAGVAAVDDDPGDNPGAAEVGQELRHGDRVLLRQVEVVDPLRGRLHCLEHEPGVGHGDRARVLRRLLHRPILVR